MRSIMSICSVLSVLLSTLLSSYALSRDGIQVVGSSTVYPFSTVVAERYGRSSGSLTPTIESTGSGGGMKLFCSGVGVNHPDITNSSRRMKKSEFERCMKNGVEEIIEVQIGYDGIVIANDAMQFSAGVNLNYFYDRAVNKKFKDIDIFLNNFQQSLYQLQHAKFPVVSCPSGLAIGGGYEVISQTSFIAAHSNSVLGLVESLVGLIPAGGGCKEMLRRWANHSDIKNDPKLLSLKVFNLIGYATTADSPIKAKVQQFLGDRDVMVMSKDRLIEEADKIIFLNKENYQSLDSASFSLPGSSVMSDMMDILYELKDKKVIGEHGIEVGKKLGYMLSGGDTMASTILTEQNLYDLEREIFIDLISQKPTQERIRHTLDTGKPLFN